MKIERIQALHSVTMEPQHSHECTVCGRQYGEFTDSECLNGHKYHLCNSSCEMIYQRVKEHLEKEKQ